MISGERWRAQLSGGHPGRRPTFADMRLYTAAKIAALQSRFLNTRLRKRPKTTARNGIIPSRAACVIHRRDLRAGDESKRIALSSRGVRRFTVEAEAAFAEFFFLVVVLPGGEDAGAAEIADDLIHVVAIHHR